MKFKALLAAFLALPLALAAQSTSPTASVQGPSRGPAVVAGLLYAANFAHWTASPTPSGTRWDNPGECFATSGGVTFPMFSTTAPITIVDTGVPANTETVTPSNAFYSGAGCSVSLPATHSHSNYYLQSGTLGLQEAANFAGSGYAVVVVTPDWVAMGGTSPMISAATLGAHTTVLDERTNAITVPNPITSTGVTTTALVAGGTAATITSGCSTCSVVTGGALAGTFTAGATSAVTPVITPGVTAPNGFACTLQDLTHQASAFTQTATNSTTATFSGTANGSSDKLVFNCIEF